MMSVINENLMVERTFEPDEEQQLRALKILLDDCRSVALPKVETGGAAA